MFKCFLSGSYSGRPTQHRLLVAEKVVGVVLFKRVSKTCNATTYKHFYATNLAFKFCNDRAIKIILQCESKKFISILACSDIYLL